MWPNKWRVIVVCMLLNRTTRRAVEKIVPKLFAKWPDASSMGSADFAELEALIAPLGFKTRRTENLIAMSRAFAEGKWSHPSELPGIGQYASDAWDIFVEGRVPQERPRDGEIGKYYDLVTRYKK